ncbi:hypothetical protein P7C73_g2645, partial [Tremellales sp. Uapishka_1]
MDSADSFYVHIVGPQINTSNIRNAVYDEWYDGMILQKKPFQRDQTGRILTPNLALYAKRMTIVPQIRILDKAVGLNAIDKRVIVASRDELAQVRDPPQTWGEMKRLVLAIIRIAKVLRVPDLIEKGEDHLRRIDRAKALPTPATDKAILSEWIEDLPVPEPPQQGPSDERQDKKSKVA